MTASTLTIHRGAAAAAAVLLLATGAATSYFLTRSTSVEGGTQVSSSTASATAPMPSTTQTGAPAAASAPLADVVVPVAPDAIERARIVVTQVATGTTPTDIRLPGRVEPNAYRQVVVTPLVSGRVVRVSAELGAHVRRGQRLADIYSPELAEAQTKYVSAKAMLDAHDRELQRTHKLVEIGAASRQELERIHAEHAAQTAAAQSARSQLELLGVPAPTIDTLGPGSVESTTIVSAPIDGVVTERAANVGVNVDPATKLFTVIDLSTVWIVADVYEKEFATIHVGTDTTITTAAYPGVLLRGRISYIDPQVNPETRTAKVRVEVPNPRGELRLGMYADVVATATAGGSVPVVPRAAIQNIGDRTVVYIANPRESGKFTEREVRLGVASEQRVAVESGVQPGDLIVTDGSFYLRAERERLGLRPALHPSVSGEPNGAGTAAPSNVQSAKIVVNEQGFDPAKVVVRAGAAARFTFLRTTDKTCATEVVFPSLNIKRALPLNLPVEINFVPSKAGEIAFVCGMNMLKGVVVVE